MLKITDLHANIDGKSILKGINLEIKPGEVHAIMGPNGSGKTTLIKSILGMVVPNKGNISVSGKAIKKNWKYRQEIDYLPQIANFPVESPTRSAFTPIRSSSERCKLVIGVLSSACHNLPVFKLPLP